MRRSALVTVAVLGGLVCLLGGTVLYSALQDTARTGTNSVESGALGASADIQLATATDFLPFNCGTYSENLASGLITATGVSPGYRKNEFICIKNVGSQQVTLTAAADELTDVDLACTGDEDVNGDATCGGDQAGELSSVLGVAHQRMHCSSGEWDGVPASPIVLKDNATTNPLELGTLAAGATACFQTVIEYRASTPNAATQKAQSDRATWRFKFTAQA
jgi:hypothetical protein